MKHFLRLGLLAAVIAAGLWSWTVLFPSPEKVIRNRLARLASLASFSSNEGNIARVANIERMGTFFAENIEVVIDVPGVETHSFTRREELQQAAMQARSAVGALRVEFPDIHMTFAPDKRSATADVTLKAKVSGQNDLIVQELAITFDKTNRDWLITRIETVKTLQH
jgi:hypothetical protein